MISPPLSRRERQVLEILYARGTATAAEVLEALPDPPTYSAVRALLRVLEEKGHIVHERQGRRYVFVPKVAPRTAALSALKQVVTTFFGGSASRAALALLDDDAFTLSAEERAQLEAQLSEKEQEEREHE